MFCFIYVIVDRENSSRAFRLLSDLVDAVVERNNLRNETHELNNYRSMTY